MGIKRRQTILLKSFLIGLFFLVESCNLGVAHMEFVSLDNGVWDKDQEVVFEFTPKDSTEVYDWYIHLRNTQDYPYSNLYLITELSTDEGFLKKDTISYTMANPDGTWVGNASGSLVEHKIPLNLQKTFSSTKPHKLTIRQAMRALGSVQPLQKLNGISDIGYSIETSEK